MNYTVKVLEEMALALGFEGLKARLDVDKVEYKSTIPDFCIKSEEETHRYCIEVWFNADDYVELYFNSKKHFTESY